MNSEALLENLHIPISEDELQTLIDVVAESAGEKAKYMLKMGRTRTCAHTWKFHTKGRRIIQFGKQYLHADSHTLIKTIIHEIGHFKECERGRRKLRYYQKRVCNPAIDLTHTFRATDTYGYHKHKAHTKRFDRIVAKLTAKVEKEYGESL
jgi:hypothetical protein